MADNVNVGAIVIAPDVNIKADAIGEVAQKMYDDVRPVVYKVREIMYSALLSFQNKFTWLSKHNVEEVSMSVADKLRDVDPDLLEAPEPYIAVPAIQAITYCMDNTVLRNMYATLLANSMNKETKHNTHPGFVHIIEQLCPDEAKILELIEPMVRVPTIGLRYENSHHKIHVAVKLFSDFGNKANCDYPEHIEAYLNNLIRLGLLEVGPFNLVLADDSLYEPLKQHQIIVAAAKRVEEIVGLDAVKYDKGFCELTAFGVAFFHSCIKTPRRDVVTMLDKRVVDRS